MKITAFNKILADLVEVIHKHLSHLVNWNRSIYRTR